MMASIGDLKDALVQAHNAGDTQGATVLAGEIKRLQAMPGDRGFGTAIAQGGTFGFADEARGLLGAGMDVAGGLAPASQFGQRYRDIRDQERQAYERYQTEHPIASSVGELAGGVALGIPSGIRAAGTNIGRNLAANIAAKPFTGRVTAGGLLGAAGGAGSGALAGAGAAPEMADVPMRAVGGAAIGAPMGLAGGAGAEALGSGARAVMTAAQRARSPERAAARAVERAVSRSGMTPDEALEVASMGGPRGMLADVSESTREALETTTQQSGAAQGLAKNILKARSKVQARDLLGAAGEGKKHQVLNALQKVRQDEASPLYERAFEQGVDQTGELERVFKDLEEFSPGIWNEAKKLGKLAEANKGASGAIGDLGDVRPSLRGWQYMKERLDDMVSGARGSGDNKRANAIAGTRRRLLAELDEQNPDFARARSMWAGAARFEEMIGEARKFMTEPADDFLAKVDDLADVDLEAIRVGAIQAIQDRVERGQWTHDVAKFFRTPSMERKMRALFENPADYADFQSRLSVTTQQQRTFDAVRGQSATARRLAAAAESNDWISDAMGLAGEALTGTPSPGTLVRAGQMAARQARRLKPGWNEEAREMVARQLLEQDPATRFLQDRYRQALLGQPMPQPTQGLLSGGIGMGLGAGAGLLSQ